MHWAVNTDSAELTDVLGLSGHAKDENGIFKFVVVVATYFQGLSQVTAN